MKSAKKMTNRVGGQQRVLVLLAQREVRGQPMQVDSSLHGLGRTIRELGQQGRDNAGQDVAAAAFGHARIAGRVDGDLAIRMGDKRAPAF